MAANKVIYIDLGSLQKKPILLVLSDETILELSKKALETKGWTVFTAKNNQEALEIIEKENVCLNFIDFKLQSPGPIMLLKDISLKFPGLSTIFLFDSFETTKELTNSINLIDLTRLGIRNYEFFKNDADSLSDALHDKAIQIFLEDKEKNVSSGPTGEGMTDVRDKDFFPIHVERVRANQTITFNLYAKIRAGRYIKLINENDQFEEDRLSKYKEKGIQYLYYSRQDRVKYIRFCNQINKKLISSGTLSIQEKNLTLLDLFKCFADEVYEGGFKENMLKDAENMAKSAISVVEENKTLTEILKDLGKIDPTLYHHHHICALIAGMVIKDFDWYTPQMAESLVTACYIHDLGKSKIAPEISLKRPHEMSERELQAYQQHPIYGVEIIKKDPSINENIIKVVSEHHEKIDGSGFPRALTDENINRLSKILTVVDTFCHFMVDKELTADMAIAEFTDNKELTKGLDPKTLDALVFCFAEDE